MLRLLFLIKLPGILHRGIRWTPVQLDYSMKRSGNIISAACVQLAWDFS